MSENQSTNSIRRAIERSQRAADHGNRLRELELERQKTTSQKISEQAMRDTEAINAAAAALDYRYGGPYSIEQHKLMRAEAEYQSWFEEQVP